VILFAALAAATLGAMEKLPSRRALFIAVGVMHVLISIVFAILDQRCRRLIKVCLEAVRKVKALPGWPVAIQDEALLKSSLSNRVIFYTGAFP